MPYTSRIPTVMTLLEARLEAVAEKAADEVVAEAQRRVPYKSGNLHDAIHKEAGPLPGEYVVLAGDSEVFYGHLVEHGTVKTGAQPFLIPAAEDVKDNIDSISREALSGF